MYRIFQRKTVYYAKLSPYKRIFRDGVPIFTYHKVGAPPRGVRMKNLYVSLPFFERHLKELWKHGFRTARLGEWTHFTQPNNREFLMTFDDGSRTVLQLASGLLHQFGFFAIQYLVADRLGGKNEWDIPQGEVEDMLMDESEVRAWLSAGHEIGSHTMTHPHLAQLNLEQAREEIFSSKKKLEDLFGVPIRHFCYPYGSWKPWVRDLVEEAEYETAVTTQPGICANITDPFTLPRIDVRPPPRNIRGCLDRLLPWAI